MRTCYDYYSFTPLFAVAQAQAMVELCERFGSYGMYSEEPTFRGFGEGLPARYDAVRNFIKTGGRLRRAEPISVLAARTNYFRETYAYGTKPRIDGIEPFLFFEGFVEAARQLHGRPIIEPAIVFANLLVPGQELAVHTDVPEFRGINRTRHPQWLIVAMRHSGLFESWRMPIATAVAWFHDCHGGEFAFYPHGPEAAPIAHPVRFNTALLLDTDSVFHGVDRVAESAAPIARLKPGMRLRHDGKRHWSAMDGEEVVARYGWDELRFSVSWKAYCFADEAEHAAWRAHKDDVSVDSIVARFVDDLRQRNLLGTQLPDDRGLAELIIDTYIHYPSC